MFIKRIRALAIGIGLLVAAGYFSRNTWRPLFAPDSPAPDEHGEIVAKSEVTKIAISEQAESGLGIVTRPIRLQDYWQSLEIPGSVVDRPGESDRAVPAPAGGHIASIAARPGETVRPGAPLFSIRLSGDLILKTQSELHASVKEIEYTASLKTLLSQPSSAAVVPQSRLIELDQQEVRLKAAATGSRQILLASGLSASQIADAEKGKFTTEIHVVAPPAATGLKGADSGPPFLEVQELKLNVGDAVQAGQAVFILANHRLLYVEGRAFKSESKALALAAKEARPVGVEFVEETRGDWPAVGPLTIHHLANSVDAESRTFAFYLSLPNESDSYTRDGQTFLTWRFRPGQRVRLKVPVQKRSDVFVVPIEAVVRDGAETYVFRRNGDFFERRTVAVLHEDSSEAVLKDDGSLSPRQQVVVNGAAALNRALKALQASGQASNVHVHADGTTHAH